MTEYNAADTKAIRRAIKADKASTEQRLGVIASTMSNPAGRDYIYSVLERCHVFASTYSPSALAMAFAEGERNIGLQLLADVMSAAPEQYVFMMREANDRSASSGPIRSSPDSRRNGDDSGPLADGPGNGHVESDWDPDPRDEASD